MYFFFVFCDELSLILFISHIINWFELQDKLLILDLHDFTSQFIILLLDNLLDILWNFKSVDCTDLLLQFNLLLYILRSNIIIGIDLDQVVCYTLLNICHPVGRFPWVSTFRIFVNIHTVHFADLNIIVFAPLIIVSIIDKSEIMASLGISIVNTHGMQMIWVLLKIRCIK